MDEPITPVAPGAPQEGSITEAPGVPSEPATEAPTQPETPAAIEGEKPAEPAPEQQSASREWAKLARKDKALREREAAMKATEERLRAIEALAEKAKSDPLALAEVFGADLYERMTMALYEKSGGQKPEPKPEDRIEALERRWAEHEKFVAEARVAAEQSRKESGKVAAIQSVFAVAAAAPDKYRRIAKLGDETHDLIWQTANELHAETGGKFSDTQVLDAVEARLAEAYKRLAIEDARPTEAAAQLAEDAVRSFTSQTLTNRGASDAPRAAPTTNGMPLDADARDRAILEQFRFW